MPFPFEPGWTAGKGVALCELHTLHDGQSFAMVPTEGVARVLASHALMAMACV